MLVLQWNLGSNSTSFMVNRKKTLWTFDKQRRFRLISSPDNRPTSYWPRCSPPSPQVQASSRLGTSDLGSCEHTWANTAAYVRGRRRECVRQLDLFPRSRGSQIISWCSETIQGLSFSAASIRRCGCKLHLCFREAACDYILQRSFFMSLHPSVEKPLLADNEMDCDIIVIHIRNKVLMLTVWL